MWGMTHAYSDINMKAQGLRHCKCASFSRKYDSNMAVCVHCIRLIYICLEAFLVSILERKEEKDVKGHVTSIMHAKYQCSIFNTSEDMSLLKVFCDRQTEKQTDGETRLKCTYMSSLPL